MTSLKLYLGKVTIEAIDSLTSKRVIMRTERPIKCFVPLLKQRVRLAP